MYVESKKKEIQISLLVKQRLRDLEEKSKGKDRGRINYKVGINIYTLLYIKQINNKEVL